MSGKIKPAPTAPAPSSPLVRLVDHASLAIVCCAAFMPFLSFTMMGIWITVEPVVAGWFMLAAIAACLLLLRQISGIGISIPWQLYPLAAFVIWIAAITPLQPYITSHLMGTPETGEGVASFCGLLVMAWLISDVWRNEKHRRYIILSYITAAILMAAIEIGGIKIVAYPDYLAFIAIAAITAATFWKGKNITLHIGQLFFWLMVASNNMAGGIITAAALLLWWLLNKYGYKTTTRLPALIAISSPLIFGIMMLAFNHTETAPSASGSLGARVIVTGIASEVMAEASAAEIIHGHGWGSTSDMVAAKAMINNKVKLFLGRDYAPDWVGVSGDMFHSHNEIIEALLAAGIIGALIMLIWLWRVTASAGNLWLAWGWASVAALSGLWFWLPHVLPSIALMAGISGDSKKHGNRIIGIIAAIICAGTMLYATAVQTGDMVQGMQINLMAAEAPPPENFSAFEWMHGSYKRFFMTGQGLLSDLANENYMLENGVNPRFPTNHHAEWLKLVLADIDRLEAAGKNTPRLRVLEANIINALCTTLKQKSVDKLRTEMIPQWQKRIEKIFFAMPKRNDLLLPFYLAAETHPEWQLDAAALSKHILARYPEEPVSLWFSGLYFYKNGDKANAMLNMQRALALGVDRFVPVTDDMRQLIKGAEFGSQ